MAHHLKSIASSWAEVQLHHHLYGGVMVRDVESMADLYIVWGKLQCGREGRGGGGGGH